jgi:hypothetical protein
MKPCRTGPHRSSQMGYWLPLTSVAVIDACVIAVPPIGATGDACPPVEPTAVSAIVVPVVVVWETIANKAAEAAMVTTVKVGMAETLAVAEVTVPKMLAMADAATPAPVSVPPHGAAITTETPGAAITTETPGTAIDATAAAPGATPISHIRAAATHGGPATTMKAATTAHHVSAAATATERASAAAHDDCAATTASAAAETTATRRFTNGDSDDEPQREGDDAHYCCFDHLHQPVTPFGTAILVADL